MRIRSTHVSDSDKKSAKVFFDAFKTMYDLEDSVALDMFARDGALTVSNYWLDVRRLDLWELAEEHRAALDKFAPSEIRIGCSYKSALESKCEYDLIVIDTPQGLHKDHAGTVRTEHFDALMYVAQRLLAPKALLVLYVNKRPYDRAVEGEHGYDQYEEYDFQKWMKNRQDFYGGNPKNLTEDRAVAAYRRFLLVRGYEIKSMLSVPCFSDVPGREPYAFRLGLEVARG